MRNINKEKMREHEKKVWQDIKKDLERKNLKLNSRDNIITYLKDSNSGREIYGAGLGISFSITVLGGYMLRTEGSIGIPILILGFVLVVLSLRPIYNLRVVESKLVEFLRK